ncbi:MAG: protein jag [Clostridiaceae bacterium]|jgi:spoIIIJ-associated protein|nr:protein jag [Clostridiaceae bacterium]
MNRIEVTAKTVDEAVKSALDKLNAQLEDVTVKVIDEGTKGLFGLGGKEATVIVSVNDNEQAPLVAAKEFVDGLLEKMNLDCESSVAFEDEYIKVVISGSDVGGIIGRRGETLDAVQYLTNIYVNKGMYGEKYNRVLIDAENYRAKREETLIRLANKMAQKALNNRRDMMLEPMNPYERRIIHSTLQANPQVTTRSVGEDPNRKIIISPK